MVFVIDALRVGSAAMPSTTLDVSGNMRTSADASISSWCIGTLGTANAAMCFAGLPANAAAVSQGPNGQTMINAGANASVQFGDSGVCGLQYSRSSFIGNLTLAGGTDSNSYVQTLTVRNNGLNANLGQAIVFQASANGVMTLDTRGNVPLCLSANGNTGAQILPSGVLFMPRAQFSNNAVVTTTNNCLVLQAPCVTVNQTTAVPNASLDILGNVHVASGNIRLDGGSLSIGYPGMVNLDSPGVPGGRFCVDNQSRCNVGGQLNVAGPAYLNQQLNLVAGQVMSLNGDPNHTVQYDGTFDGPRLQGFAGGVLGTSQSTANALAWTSNSATSFLPFSVASPFTVLANTTTTSPDPYLALGRQVGSPDVVLAPASTVNLHSNAASVGDTVLKNRNGGNVIIQSSNTGPGIFLNNNNCMGIKTTTINPVVILDVPGAAHLGTDNIGSRILNLSGSTYYSTIPTYRQLALFYASNNAGNGALLTVKGACGSWTGSRAELIMTVSTTNSVVPTAQWIGGVASGVDVQVWTGVSGISSVWAVVTAAYAVYDFDVVYTGQGFTQLAQNETPVPPTGTMTFSASASPAVVANTGSVKINNTLGVNMSVVNGYNIQVQGNIGITTGSLRMLNSDPGDIAVKSYTVAGDAYGVGQYTAGRSRLVTSSYYGPATTGFALAGTDTNGTGMQDLLTASNSYIFAQRQLIVGTNLDTSVGASSGINTRVGNISHALFTNQAVPVTSSNGITNTYINHDWNFPNQQGPYPGGRMCVNDSNYSADFRWSTKSPGSVTNPMTERLTLTAAGNFGINMPSPAYTLDVNGSARVGSKVSATYNINVVSSVNAWTQICNISDVNNTQTYFINVTLVQCRAYNSLIKVYQIPLSYGQATAGWLRINPLFNNGPSNGNDLALDINTNAGSIITYVRVVRTAVGTNCSTGLTAFLDVWTDSGVATTINYDGYTNTNATATGIFAPQPLSLTPGLIGVNNPAPSYPLDVIGSVALRSRLIRPTWTSIFYRIVNASPQTGGAAYVQTSKSMFALNSAASNDTTGMSFVADAILPAANVTSAGFSLNYTGLWTLQYGARFAFTGGTETSFYSNVAQYSSQPFLGDSTGTGPCCSLYTGYFNAGDIVYLYSYVSSQNYIGSGQLCCTLNQQTA